MLLSSCWLLLREQKLFPTAEVRSSQGDLLGKHSAERREQLQFVGFQSYEVRL